MFLTRVSAFCPTQSKVLSLSKSASLGAPRFRLDKPRFASEFGGPNAPLVFEETSVDSYGMMVANVGNRGPFFLEKSQHHQLEKFISGPPSNLFLFSGTVKSGKSTLLNFVLPGMVLAYHKNISSKLEPVFLRFKMRDKVGPDAALSAFCIHIRNKSHKFGIQLAPEMGTSADELLGDFGEQLAKQGKELWVLLDEVQQPLLYCSKDQQDAFGVVLKDMFDQCVAGGAKIAMAGSGMLGLLINLRHLPTEGTFLWGHTSIFSRGQSYNTSTFTAMIQRIRDFYQDKLSPELHSFVTPQLVLQTFSDHKDWVSRRPALLGYLYWLLRTNNDTIFGQTPDPATVFGNCWKIILAKLQEESNLPTATALDSLSQHHCLLLRQLALGDLAHDKLAEMDRETFQIMSSLLDSYQPTLELQPPYGTLFSKWILPDGRLCSKIEEQRVSLFPVPEYNLLLMVDMSQKFDFPNHEEKISSAVEQAFFEFYHLTKPSSDSDAREQIMNQPAVKEALNALHSNSQNSGKYAVSVNGMIFSKAAYEFENLSDFNFKNKWGYKFLSVLRHLHHHYMVDPNVWKSVPHLLVEKLVATAVSALVSSQTRFAETANGYLYDTKRS